MSTMFIHGAGRRGRANWPVQASTIADADFPVIEEWATAASTIGASLRPGTVLVAHSRGAIPAVEAAEAAPERIARLVLIEPALYGLPAGPAVAAHNARMAPVIAAASGQDAAGFWSAFLTALTGRLPSMPLDADGIEEAERIRRAPAVWDYIPSPEVFSRIPTLVVTGGWLDEYEEIAAALVEAGAEHLVLPGHGHRPQDHPDFDRAVGLI